MRKPAVVSAEQWHTARAEMMAKEKEFTRSRDALAAQRRFVNDRGDEAFVNTWNSLDITALGRQESWEDSPAGYPQSAPYQWWRRHDSYAHHG